MRAGIAEVGGVVQVDNSEFVSWQGVSATTVLGDLPIVSTA
jgi:hypothetical protein